MRESGVNYFGSENWESYFVVGRSRRGTNVNLSSILVDEAGRSGDGGRFIIGLLVIIIITPPIVVVVLPIVLIV